MLFPEGTVVFRPLVLWPEKINKTTPILAIIQNLREYYYILKTATPENPTGIFTHPSSKKGFIYPEKKDRAGIKMARVLFCL